MNAEGEISLESGSGIEGRNDNNATSISIPRIDDSCSGPRVLRRYEQSRRDSVKWERVERRQCKNGTRKEKEKKKKRKRKVLSEQSISFELRFVGTCRPCSWPNLPHFLRNILLYASSYNRAMMNSEAVLDRIPPEGFDFSHSFSGALEMKKEFLTRADLSEVRSPFAPSVLLKRLVERRQACSGPFQLTCLRLLLFKKSPPTPVSSSMISVLSSSFLVTFLSISVGRLFICVGER